MSADIAHCRHRALDLFGVELLVLVISLRIVWFGNNFNDIEYVDLKMHLVNANYSKKEKCLPIRA